MLAGLGEMIFTRKHAVVVAKHNSRVNYPRRSCTAVSKRAGSVELLFCVRPIILPVMLSAIDVVVYLYHIICTKETTYRQLSGRERSIFGGVT